MLNYILCQSERESDSEYLCISDYIAPTESGIKDYIGMFAVSGGFGCEELCQKYEDKLDDYSIILVKAVADRLAEAFAEYMHELVRKELWGYSKEELMEASDLHKIKYKVSNTRVYHVYCHRFQLYSQLSWYLEY